MPCSFTTYATNQEQDQFIVNLEDPSIDLEYLPIPNHTLKPHTLIDLLKLPRLLRNKMHGKKSLVDYSNSQVVTPDQ